QDRAGRSDRAARWAPAARPDRVTRPGGRGSAGRSGREDRSAPADPWGRAARRGRAGSAWPPPAARPGAARGGGGRARPPARRRRRSRGLGLRVGVQPVGGRVPDRGAADDGRSGEEKWTNHRLQPRGEPALCALAGGTALPDHLASMAMAIVRDIEPWDELLE